MAVEFKDYSIRIKAALNDVSAAWLTECGNEVASKAKATCTMTDDNGELKKSYRAARRYKEHIKVGTPLESGLWEEYGTGEHAAGGNGRQGWWVYIDGGSGYEGETNSYKSQAEAEDMADYIKREYKKPAVATNGREPQYTLENAFKTTMPKQEAELRRRLKERFGE